MKKQKLGEVTLSLSDVNGVYFVRHDRRIVASFYHKDHCDHFMEWLKDKPILKYTDEKYNWKSSEDSHDNSQENPSPPTP